MSLSIKPISDVTHRGRHALIEALGVVDAMRFLNQLSPGSGNYTAERAELLQTDTVDKVVAEIKARRTGGR